MVLIGGRRGAGKSFTCSNIASNTFDDGDSVIYFTIEMTARQIMQRCCSVSTGVPINALRNRNLSIGEWQLVAEWWSNRFEDGEHAFREYLEHRDFDKYHSELTVRPLREKQLDVVYNPTLTLGNIRTELDKKVSQIKPKVVIVDYVNQVKRAAVSNSRMGQYDWTEQIEVSKSLKAMAQDYNVVMVSPYQTDATGEARFAKGILDSADTAFSLDPHMKEDNIITFSCVKMRNGEETDFTSTMDWTTLRIGPETGKVQTEEESNDEDPYDI
jgi:replicative DNA helicase